MTSVLCSVLFISNIYFLLFLTCLFLCLNRKRSVIGWRLGGGSGGGVGKVDSSWTLTSLWPPTGQQRQKKKRKTRENARRRDGEREKRREETETEAEEKEGREEEDRSLVWKPGANTRGQCWDGEGPGGAELWVGGAWQVTDVKHLHMRRPGDAIGQHVWRFHVSSGRRREEHYVTMWHTHTSAHINTMATVNPVW